MKWPATLLLDVMGFMVCAEAAYRKYRFRSLNMFILWASLLGVQAGVPPMSSHPIVCGNHSCGYCLCFMRSLSHSRYYIQCPLTNKIEHWGVAAFWDERRPRHDSELARHSSTDPSIEESIAQLRSFAAWRPSQFTLVDCF